MSDFQERGRMGSRLAFCINPVSRSAAQDSLQPLSDYTHNDAPPGLCAFRLVLVSLPSKRPFSLGLLKYLSLRGISAMTNRAVVSSGWVLSFRFFLSVPNDQNDIETPPPSFRKRAKVIEQQTIKLRPVGSQQIVGCTRGAKSSFVNCWRRRIVTSGAVGAVARPSNG
jgi:hypothetical protein